MSKYWFRLLMFGILLGTIPMITIGWISYSISSRDIEEKVKEGNMQFLHQTQMRVEQHLKTIEMSAIQFANSSPVTNTLNTKVSAHDFDSIQSLYKGLNHLLTFSGVAEAQIVNFEHNWFLSTTKFGSYDQLEEKEQLALYGNHQKSLYWLNPANDLYQADRSEEEGLSNPVIRMVLKIPPMPVTNKPRELLTIDILSSEIRNYLNQSRGLGEYYIMEHQGGDLLSDPGINQYARINEAIVRSIEQQQLQEGFLSAPLAGQEMGVTYRVSPYNGWVYVSIVSIDEITSQTKKIAQLTLLLSLAIIVAVGLIAFILSRKIYSPVRKLVEYSKGVQNELNSDGKFSYEFEHPVHLEVLKMFRKLYEEGAINQDFAAVDESEVLKVFDASRAGLRVAVVQNAGSMTDRVLQSDPDAVFDVEPLTGPHGIRVPGELDQLITDAMIKFVMGSIDEAGYQAEIQTWRSQGGDRIIQEYEEAYANLNR